ncbi:hypothetical protein CANARDRAFT_29662 [[Candida] arabinofermentans NRRL YB-2248]|uniref:Uncharacterized protein n=1 Tax=[Candida] arabinofermentans NRRL YB-2248 TaxID=983967 RepID=A0A1E4SWQ5_9ASCO|nr:hypothetical protein CANARDRAFT_29662 [[Candida] arabinofermentans NRRL YB-2248]
MSFLDSSVQLLFINGTRIPLTINQGLLDDYGFELDAESFRIGDLRNYIHSHWQKLLKKSELTTAESTENINSAPVYEEQIQMIHLGNRLNPNDLLSTLNIALSPVLHIIVKPLDQVQVDQSSDRRFFDIKIPQGRRKSNSSKRRGSTSNTPVPTFIAQNSTSLSASKRKQSVATIHDDNEGVTDDAIKLSTQPLSQTETEIEMNQEVDVSKSTEDKAAVQADEDDQLTDGDALANNMQQSINSNVVSDGTTTENQETGRTRQSPRPLPEKGGGCCVIM